MVRLVTLGGLKLEGADFRHGKPLLVLAFLSLEGPQERRHLAELFWPGSRNALGNLATSLTRLRHGTNGGVEADDVRAWSALPCDASELLTVLEGGDSQVALELYRGRFLDGFNPKGVGSELEEWVYATREALGARVRMALLELAEGHARVGEFTLGAGLARRAYLLPGAPEPTAEELERLYLLLQAGEHAEAHEVRKEAAGYDLDLSMSVEEVRKTLHRDEDPAKKEVRHNLPVQPTRFVGREAEKAKLSEMLGDLDCRLLTITGPGGIGKTRLAIEVARGQLGRLSEGVFFVPFAPVASPASMPFAIADALGLGAGDRGVTQQLLGYLRDRQVLLVLDNLEHLLNGVDLVRDLWQHTRNLKLLVTSRERLNLHAEKVFVLSGLTSPEEVPVEQSDAVVLFMQTARDRGHEVKISEGVTPSMVRICQLVGGMPLAIELAASWLNALTVEEVAAEIVGGLDVLQASARDVPERHRSIRAVFESSWQLLSDRERETLKSLSVFRGGFRRDAASAVARADVATLGSLVDKSLLTLSAGGRYEQHPLVLEYVHNRLAERPQEQADAEEKHGLYYLGFLNEHHRLIEHHRGPIGRIKENHELINAELLNIQTAWVWAIDQQRHEQIRDSAYAFNRIHWDQHRQVGYELFSQATTGLDEMNREHHAALGYALVGRASLGNWLDPIEDVRSTMKRALALLRPLDEKLGVAWALRRLGVMAIFHDRDVEKAQAYLQESLTLARSAGVPSLAALIMYHRYAIGVVSESSIETIRKVHEETQRELRKIGNHELLFLTLADFGNRLVDHKLLEEGRATLLECLEQAQEHQLSSVMNSAKSGLAKAAWYSGDLEEAETLLLEVLGVARDPDRFGGVVDTLSDLGALMTQQGRFREAEGYLKEALGLVSKDEKLLMANLGIVRFLGELRIAEGALAAGAEWLSFVVHHAASGSRAGATCRRLLEDLKDQVPPEELAAAVSRGEELILDDVITELLPTSQSERNHLWS